MRLSLIASLITILSTTIGAAWAADPEIKVIQPGHNITVWYGWNVSGTIFLQIDGGPGPDCLRLWWIRMGVNSDDWEVCDDAEVEFNLPLIYGELRAGHAKRQIALAVSDNAAVAYSAELCGRVIPC